MNAPDRLVLSFYSRCFVQACVREGQPLATFSSLSTRSEYSKHTSLHTVFTTHMMPYPSAHFSYLCTTSSKFAPLYPHPSSHHAFHSRGCHGHRRPSRRPTRPLFQRAIFTLYYVLLHCSLLPVIRFSRHPCLLFRPIPSNGRLSLLGPYAQSTNRLCIQGTREDSS
jgi:hypothetical protein